MVSAMGFSGEGNTVCTSRTVVARSQTLVDLGRSPPPVGEVVGQLAPGFDDSLIDGSENALAGRIQHFDTHAITESQKGGRWPTLRQLLQRALLRQAARAATAIVIGNCARADDRP